MGCRYCIGDEGQMTYEIKITQPEHGKNKVIIQSYSDDYIDTDPMELINLVYSTLIQATYQPKTVFAIMEQFIEDHKNETS